MESSSSGDTDSSFRRSSSAPAESSSSADPLAVEASAVKKPRYSCSFQSSSKFPWAIPSHKGASYALCKICKRHISVAYGGFRDLAKHEATTIHESRSRDVSTSTSLSSFFNKTHGPKRDSSVIAAEVRFSYFVGEHHLPISIADHCTKLFPLMFPDSAIAKSFRCGRTKTTSVIKVIAQDVLSEITKRVNNSKFFSILIDETTDITVYQQMGIMIRYFDNVLGEVQTSFIKLEPVREANAECLFEAINKSFCGSNSPILNYGNLVGVGSDGTNVMMGRRNSVLSRLKEKQPPLIVYHCNCHLAALIANHACSVLPDYLDDITIQTWYYFQKSPKRLRAFENYQVFTESKPHKLLKAGQTRWLSLELCANRLLEQYEALLSYFRSTDESSAMVQRILTALEKPMTKAYLMFLSDALPIINNFNKVMQKRSPTIHFLYNEISSFVKKMLLRFMTPTAVQSAINITALDIKNNSLYLPLSEIFIGEKVKQYFSSDDNDLSTAEMNKFRETCRDFWIEGSEYAIKKLPLNDTLLKNLQWLTPGMQNYELLEQVLAVGKKLPQVVPAEQLPTLQEEFLDYCTSTLPQGLEQDVPKYWHFIESIKDIARSDVSRYPLLSKLAKAILIIPHGNADIERMFSQLGLNKTKLRNRLGTDTLTSLLTLQINIEESCSDFNPSKELLQKCVNAIATESTS